VREQRLRGWWQADAPLAGAPIEWEHFNVSGAEGGRGYAKTMPKEVMDSIARNKVCLKGARAGPRMRLSQSVASALRRHLTCSCSVRAQAAFTQPWAAAPPR
jgi:isocitrate/isopropylmalate dehydrogenase